MNKKLLSVVGLGKVFHSKNDDVVAIKNVSFDVYENEFISIVGPSGCGNAHFTLKNYY